MPETEMVIWHEIGWIVASAAILLLFGITLAFPHRPRVLPGSMGHRPQGEGRDKAGHELIRADGYIDTFAGVIEEAGGSLPPVVRVAYPGIILWWLFYLIYYWFPR